MAEFAEQFKEINTIEKVKIMQEDFLNGIGNYQSGLFNM